MIRSIFLITALSFNSNVQALVTKQKTKVVQAKTTSKKIDFSKDSKYRIDYKFGSWGILPSFKKASINVVNAWKNFQKKREIVVAVVDTGVDYGRPFLKKNLYLPGNKKVDSKNYGLDFSKGSRNKFGLLDTHGHGTHISGIIRSIFPEVKILSLKYYNPRVKNKDNLDATVRALEYAISQKVDIINYSSGGAGASIEELRVLKKAKSKEFLLSQLPVMSPLTLISRRTIIFLRAIASTT